MDILEILETRRTFSIRLTDEFKEFETVNVEMQSAHTNPNSKFFTNCSLDFLIKRERTIDEHIDFLETVCNALRELKTKLEKSGSNENDI